MIFLQHRQFIKIILFIIEHLESILKLKEENKNLPLNLITTGNHCGHLGLFPFKLYVFSFKFRIVFYVHIVLFIVH